MMCSSLPTLPTVAILMVASFPTMRIFQRRSLRCDCCSSRSSQYLAYPAGLCELFMLGKCYATRASEGTC